MKRLEQMTRLNGMSLADLKSEALALENKIQNQVMAIRFGKAKDVSTVKQLKRQLARTLTTAKQALKASQEEKE